MNKVVVFITAASKKEAKKISNELLKQRLVACCNLIDKIESIYWWKGKIESSKEVLILAKTDKDKLKRLEKLVKKIHSYDVPEIIALSLQWSQKDYLRWLNENL